MKEFQHKYIIRTLLYSKVTVVILFLIIVLLLRSIMELNDKRIEVAKLRNESELKRTELDQRVKNAEIKTETIHTKRGLEEYIRSTYPVVKEGEGVVVVYDSNTNSVTPVRKDMNVWERIIVWVRDIRGN